MITINMKQVSKNRWRLETKSGIIILDNIVVHTNEEANKYALAFVSSWHNWDFNLILWSKDENNKKSRD